jgi:hypothetical protein
MTEMEQPERDDLLLGLRADVRSMTQRIDRLVHEVDANTAARHRIDRYEEKLMGIDRMLLNIREDLSTRIVSKEEFQPIKKLVYGGTGAGLVGLLTLIFRALGIIQITPL